MNSEQSSLFAEDRPASPSVWPGSDRARTMTAGSGTRLCALLKSSGPLGAFSRILLESSRWVSTEYWLTWKASSTPQGRLRFRLVRSMPPTSGNGSGSWPTPMAGTPAQKGYNAAGNTDSSRKTKALASWPTPKVSDDNQDRRTMSSTEMEWNREGGSRSSLPLVVKMLATWATPRVGVDYGTAEHCDLSGQVMNGSSAQTENTGALNPEFVCWLMGFPEGWLDFEP